MGIKVILVDDHTVVRDGLKAIIERKAKDIEIVGEAANGEEALNLAKNCHADLYIIDISLPVMNGLELTLRLKKVSPESKVLILSMHDKNTLVEKALKSGAHGYIVKESATEEVIKAIYEVAQGRYFLSPSISGFIVSKFLDKDCNSKQEEKKKNSTLTKREREILQLLAEGYTNREIAKKLNRSLNTIHVHRNKLMHKLNLHRQVDLIRYALKEDIAVL